MNRRGKKEAVDMGLAEQWGAYLNQELAKKGRSKYRELRDRRLRCPVCRDRLLYRIAIGPDHEGNRRTWLIIEGWSTAMQVIPRCGYALEVYRGQLTGSCQRCKSSVLFTPTDEGIHAAVIGSPNTVRFDE